QGPDENPACVAQRTPFDASQQIEPEHQTEKGGPGSPKRAGEGPNRSVPRLNGEGFSGLLDWGDEAQPGREIERIRGGERQEGGEQGESDAAAAHTQTSA